MTTFTEKIAALPEWPKEIARDGAYKVYKGQQYTVYDDGRSAETPYQTDLAEAALARLALAREWIEKSRHLPLCQWKAELSLETLTYVHGNCTCGRDALLAALEVPK